VLGNAQRVLDRLLEGDFERTQDRNIPELVAGRGGQ
jgi:hypothetical protein